MKIVALIACAAFAAASLEAANETRSVKPFTRIAVEGPIDLFISQIESSEDQVNSEINVTAADEIIDAVIIENIGDTLHVSLKSLHPSLSSNIIIHASTQDIEFISSKGPGSINGDGHITFKQLAIDTSGDGDVNMTLSGELLTVSLKGSGSMEVSGNVEEQKIAMAGSGTFNGKALKSQKATVTLYGSGEALIDASKTLEVNLFGNGDITYKGNPKVTSNIQGSGKVNPS